MEVDTPGLVRRIAELNIAKIVVTSGYPVYTCTPWMVKTFTHSVHVFQTKIKLRVGVAEFDSPIWKIDDEM